MTEDETVLVLGGAGLIGLQVARRIARDLHPRRVIVASLYQKEVRAAVDFLRRDVPTVQFVGFWGDVFLREEWNAGGRQARLTRKELSARRDLRTGLREDLFGDFDAAYRRSQLVQLVLEYRPDVIVDSINTATAISYQDTHSAGIAVERELDRLEAALDRPAISNDEISWSPEAPRTEPIRRALDTLLISQPIPQLTRHVLLLQRAMLEAQTRLYVKIGTTGTGGMGLNIPYTHSEDRPSTKLMAKTAVAFAHTGLLFLLARTPGGPVVKELKPGAMVGHADISCRTITERGRPVVMHSSRQVVLAENLALREPAEHYHRLGKLRMVVMDTGENGLFTRGEFEAIAHLEQMEFVTPEEIAQQVVHEIRGSNTGRDVIAAIDGAVINPSYRAGYLRQFALQELERVEAETGAFSVALGQLGPPELGKLLWEAYLLKLSFRRLSKVLDSGVTIESLTEGLVRVLDSVPSLRETITSVGLPILMPDGRTLVRGPFIRIPETTGVNEVACTPEGVDKWAMKGWVDLRADNIASWRRRFSQMKRAAQALRGRGTAAVTRQGYLSDEILIGAVVGWIFNNEMGGYRIK